MNKAGSKKDQNSTSYEKNFLTVFSAVLTFAGPTYVVYVLLKILNINWFVSIISGMVIFIIGLIVVLRLIKDQDLN